MKRRCQICHLVSDAETCPACGEASWSPVSSSDDAKPQPAASPKQPQQRGRGRASDGEAEGG